MKLLFDKINLILLFFTLLAVSGCSSMSAPKPSVTEGFNGIHIYSTPSKMQSSFLKDKGSGEHFCDSRGSDVAGTQSEGFGISEALVGQSEGVSESSSQGAVTLGGRSPAVLITRELMYRTCEMIMNLNLDKEAALGLYIKTLNLVTTIVQNDTTNGTTSIFGAAQVQNDDLIETDISTEEQEQ